MTTSRDGFLLFIRNDLGITPDQLPDDDSSITLSYMVAREQVLRLLRCISPILYDIAIYNLAAAYLIEFATDIPPSTFFSDYRQNNGLNAFTPGVISNSSDNGTAQSWVTPDFVKNLSPRDLQLLKTPWGRVYLGIVNELGPYRGLS